MLTRILKRRIGLTRLFSSTPQGTLELPVVDIESFLPGNQPDMEQAKVLVEGLREYGALAIKDPRIEESKNLEFIDLMEQYFESRSQIYYQGGEGDLKECYPQHGYQVGVTPELKERARLHEDTIERHFKQEPPVTPQPPPKDGKWRYFWRIGDIELEDEHLLPPQAIPEDFEGWEEKMDTWGNHVSQI